MAKKRKKVKLISWNCEVGRNPLKVKHAVQHMIWLHHPRFICLQEARGYRRVLQSIRNYEEYSPEGKSREAGDSITLVRTSTVRQIITRVLRLKSPWTGPKAGKPHDARQFIRVDSGPWAVTNVHRTRPGWSTGGTAFREEGIALIEDAKAAEAEGKNWIAPGDQNIGTRESDARINYSPISIAKSIGGRVISASKGRVDSIMVGPHIKGTAKELSTYGSDHHAVLFKLWTY